MFRVPFRSAVLLLLSHAFVVALLSLPHVAFAAGAKRVAIFLEGADDAALAEVQSVLPPELSVVDGSEFSDAFKKAGQKGQMGPTVWTKGSQRDKLLERAQKAMEATNADAAILGRIRIGKQGKELWVVWVGAGGDVRADAAVSMRGDSTERRKALRDVLEPSAKALVPPPTVSAPAEPSSSDPKDAPTTEKKDDAPKSKRTPHLHSTSIFSLGLMYELGGRHMAFNDALSKNIRPYDVLPVSMFSIAGEVYPAAPTGITVLKNIGIAARFSMAIGLSSSTKGGTEEIQNTWIRFRGGLKWRFVPGSEEGPVLALLGEFGIDQFTFGDAGDLAGQVPTVDYQYVRAGGEVRLPIGPVAFLLGGGYRGLLGVGETGARFRTNSAFAFDGLIGFSVRLPAGFEARLEGDYSRVFYSFAPEVGDEYVAGGAVDEMLGARLGVGFVY